MDHNQEMMQKALLQEITGPFHLVAPEHRPDPEEVLQWFIKNFVNVTESPKWDDYWLHSPFSVDTAKHAFHKFQPKQGDVLVATYPKTGTTWMFEIVRSVLYLKDQDLLAKAKKIQYLYSYLAFGPVSKYKVIDNLQLPRRLLATNLPAHLVNLEKLRENDTKIIHVMRNPKDQAVSWYHFAMSFPYVKNEPWTKLFPQNEKEFYDVYLAGLLFFDLEKLDRQICRAVFAEYACRYSNKPYLDAYKAKHHALLISVFVPEYETLPAYGQQKCHGKEGEGYLEHVREWYDHRKDSNLLFIFYEDLKKDIHRELRKIANFLDVNLTDDEVNQVAHMTSFKTMKKEATDAAKVSTQLVNIFRKGQVGDWKNHLTVAQSELIDANVERVLGDTDIKFIYELDQQ